MYTLDLKITIDNKYVFTSIQDVNIEKSIDTIGSKAVLRLPSSCRLRTNDKLQTNSSQTAILFKRGMSLVIELGYNNIFNTEFSGFISSVGAGTPAEIECEGFEFKLREKLEPKTFQNTTVKEIVNYCAKGLSVNSDIPDVAVESFVIKAGATALQVLNKIKEYYLLTINVNNSNLFVGLREQQNLGEVKYSLNGIDNNVISDKNLKFRTEEEKKFKVKAIVISKDNKKKEYEFGDADGEQRTFHFYDDKTDPSKLVQEELKKVKYTGFEGKFESFLFPFAQPGMIANMVDNIYTERTGKYYIPSVKTTFGRSGARREVQLGYKVS